MSDTRALKLEQTSCQQTFNKKSVHLEPYSSPRRRRRILYVARLKTTVVPVAQQSRKGLHLLSLATRRS